MSRAGGAARGLALGLLSIGLAAPGSAQQGAPAGLTLRWLGVAGFSLSDGETVLLHDPFLSRPGRLRTLFTRFRPDGAVLAGALAADGPAPELARAHLVLVGHSHYDHLGDVPWIASRTGATVVGSQTTASIAIGYGLDPDQTRVLDPGETLREGAFDVTPLESRHAPVLFGRVPLPGTLETPPDAPLHAFSFVLGDARAWLVHHRPSGLRVLLLSSAAALPEALAPLEPGVDAVLAATPGREAGFAALLVEQLRPRLVVPHHFDDFTRGIADRDAGTARDPDDLAAFEAELREAAEARDLALRVHRPALFETFRIPEPAP